MNQYSAVFQTRRDKRSNNPAGVKRAVSRATAHQATWQAGRLYQQPAYRISHASAGSSALVEAAIQEHMGLREGGRKFLAVLSLATVLQTTFTPAAMAFTDNVANGATSTGVVLNDGDRQNVNSGGTANDAVVKTRGQQYISSGGVANGTVVENQRRGGILSYADGQHVLEGGKATSTVLHSGGLLTINAGGTAIDIMRLSGSMLNFDVQGGKNTTITGSGSYGVFDYSNSGTLSGAVLHREDMMNVYQGGVANSTFLSELSQMHVYQGGVANNTIVDYGAWFVNWGGETNSTIVNSWGDYRVFDGGIDTGTIVNEGGIQSVQSAVAYSTTINSGGGVIVYRGGSALNIKQNSGGTIEFWVEEGKSVAVAGSGYYGTFDFSNDGTVSNKTLYDGIIMAVDSGGSATGITQNENGNINVFVRGGDTSTFVSGINASGVAFGLENGVATNFILYSGGQMNVSSGGSATGIIQNEGGNINVTAREGDTSTFVSGINASGVSFGLENGVANNFILYDDNWMGGRLGVDSGGVANNTTVSSGGHIGVDYGGSAINTVQRVGGNINVSVSGGDTSTFVSGINASGVVFGLENGVANNFIIYDGGYMNVLSGGTANEITVSSGGKITVSSGTLAYTGTASMAGSATISQGGILTATSMVLGDTGARLIIQRTADDILVTILSGQGGLSKEGSATLTLDAVNTHTGQNIVNAGTLRAGVNNAFGTGGYDIATGAILDLNNTSQTISELQGAGEVSIGTGGQLTVTQSTNTALAGQLNGANGTFTKAGTGTLALNHANNLLDTLNVTGGKLLVGDTAGNGAKITTTSGLHVYNAATLGGHGEIVGNVTIHPGGVLSPGNSYGTITVTGDHTFQPGSFYDVEVNAADTSIGDLTKVTGTATLAGTVRHLHTGGTVADYATPGKEWLILDSDTGLAGTFAGATSNLAFLQALLRYDTTNHDVFLYFAKGASFSEYAGTFNQRSVATALESLNQNSSLYKTILNNTTEAAAQRMLDALSGEMHSTLAGNLLMADRQFGRSFASHISKASLYRSGVYEQLVSARAAGDEQAGILAGNGMWVNVGGHYSQMDGNANAAQSTMAGPEVTAGYDARFVNGWLGGAAFRYNYKDMDVNGRNSDATINSFTTAIYGGKEFMLGPGALRLIASGAFTRHDMDTERTIRLAGLNQNLEASYGANSFQAALEAAYLFPVSKAVILEPFASLGWENLYVESARERGGNAALRKDSEDYTRTVSTLGVRASIPVHDRVELQAELGWQQTFGDVRPETTFAFTEGSNPFTVRGNTASRDMAVINVGADFTLTDNLRLNVGYDGAVGDKSQSHGGSATFTLEW